MSVGASAQPFVVTVEDTTSGVSHAYAFTKSPVLFGRGPGMHLRIIRPFISNAHGTFRFDAERITYKDLDSQNGTVVNGTRLTVGQTITIDDKATMQVGPLRFSFSRSQTAAVQGVSALDPFAAAPAPQAPMGPQVTEAVHTPIQRPEVPPPAPVKPFAQIEPPRLPPTQVFPEQLTRAPASVADQHLGVGARLEAPAPVADLPDEQPIPKRPPAPAYASPIPEPRPPSRVRWTAPSDDARSAAGDAAPVPTPASPAGPPPDVAAREEETLPPGTRLGKYAIGELLGRGGMGAVYRATHTGIGKAVAIKVLSRDVAGEREMQARFLKEAESASKLVHPHVVDVTDFGTDAAVSYMVMELLKGEDLATTIARGPMDIERAIDVMLAVCAALVAAHQAHIIHRDLKPQNIFLSLNRMNEVVPKVLDFGISKPLDAEVSANLTQAGMIMGTPHYLAPQQLSGLPADEFADQYALGVILYEMLTGRRPFDERKLFMLARAIREHRFTPPREIRPSLPPALEAIILKAMAAREEDRFDSVYHLGRALLPYASPKRRPIWAEYFDRDLAPYQIVTGAIPMSMTLGPREPDGDAPAVYAAGGTRVLPGSALADRPVSIPGAVVSPLAPGSTRPASAPPSERGRASWSSQSSPAPTDVPSPRASRPESRTIDPVQSSRPERATTNWRRRALPTVAAAAVTVAIGVGAGTLWVRRSTPIVVEPSDAPAAPSAARPTAATGPGASATSHAGVEDPVVAVTPAPPEAAVPQKKPDDQMGSPAPKPKTKRRARTIPYYKTPSGVKVPVLR